jgi:hypothetical protein
MKYLSAALLMIFAISGCNTPSEDPLVQEYRERYLTKTEPTNAMSLTDAAELVADKSEPTTAAVLGRIYAGDMDPWEVGKASFILSELPAEGHGEGHDADNCPFCKRRATKAPNVIVNFTSDGSQTIAIDARKLFGIEKGQVVVVQGDLVPGEFNSMMLKADQLFIR